MSDRLLIRSSLRDCYGRGASDADLARPRSWERSAVARWLLALCLRRDGRTDAVQRAEEILCRSNPVGTSRLPMRERATLCLAIWEAYVAFDWDETRIADAFELSDDDVAAAIGFVAAEVRAGVGPDCRQGMADVRRTVRDALKEARAVA
jgi:hypothetical protein